MTLLFIALIIIMSLVKLVVAILVTKSIYTVTIDSGASAQDKYKAVSARLIAGGFFLCFPFGALIGEFFMRETTLQVLAFALLTFIPLSVGIIVFYIAHRYYCCKLK